ncbi:MAG TPA: glycerate kinase [Candidatus Dormibacteraeota bacterium]|jgi:glycerate kinase
MKIIVAPNSFKGSLSATQAAKAIARGVREVYPDADVVEIPVADGGEGTVEALVSANGGTYEWVNVEGPLGDPVLASYGLIDGGKTAVIELASASGYVLVSPAKRDPRKTSTYGFGQLLEAARKSGARSIIAGIGSSATNDGGVGMAQALGYRFLDAAGRDLPRGGAALLRLERIDDSKVNPGWRSVKVKVACDVTNPLTGPEGASAVYGPQKGADPVTVRLLDRALGRLADVIERQYGRRVAEIPGAGAAGGTGAGLMAFLDAELVSGAALVVDASGFDRALPGAQLVITGEGRADGQTAYGKAPGEVARRAQTAGVPAVMVAGTKGAGWEALLTKGFSSVTTLAQEGDNLQDLMHDARPALTRAAALAIKELLRPKSDRRR